jgi:hypothetical protein
MFVLLFFCFGHCVVCSSSICRFRSPLWYLQTLLNRTNSIHMTTSMSRRLNILCIMINIIAFYIITLLSWLHVRVSILLTCDRIISLREEVWVHKTGLTLPLCYCIVVFQTGNIEWSCICVIEKSVLPLSTILIFDFGIVLTVWYFCFSFHYIHNCGL